MFYKHPLLKLFAYFLCIMSVVHVHVSMYYIKQSSLQEKKSKTQYCICNKFFFSYFFFHICLQQKNITIYHLSEDQWKNNMMTTGYLS